MSRTKGRPLAARQEVFLPVVSRPLAARRIHDGLPELQGLNRFTPSWEVRDGEAGLECSGFLRPAFEVSLDGNQLAPGKQVGEADRSKNPACLFLRKTIKLKKSQMIVL